MVAEPEQDRDPARLDPTFGAALVQLLGRMDSIGLPFRLVEGYRTPERQRWLYEQGRSRPGAVVTHADGEAKKSRHQSGRAADCYPVRGGRVWIPPTTSDIWRLYGSVAEQMGLSWGGRWKMRDLPHVELPEGVP